ncbi:hypothetical protein D915_001176 [Fasciola hepatica]|uniref:Dendritic cell-specific transmembrane protein-like domain-containing protein n=1 Tax=Fasciola hepatica TaxID=6192 RepID=A0A4E0RGZ7_FASHE|nr:hypothetical protein D915_001176 [Fasciola hepatica]
MWHQHLCLLGIISAFGALLGGNTLQNTVLPKGLQPNIEGIRIVLYHQIKSRLERKASLQTTGGIICLFYWLAAYGLALFPPRLTPFRDRVYQAVSFTVWHMLVQPYLFTMLFYSIYVLCFLVEDVGRLQTNLELHWMEVLSLIRNKSTPMNLVEEYTDYLEMLQRNYRCCGALSLSDWLGTDPRRDDWNDTWYPRGHDYQPWHTIKMYLPPSCCVSEKTVLCTPEAIRVRQILLQSSSAMFYSRMAPIFPQGCVDAMKEEIYGELYETIIITFIIDIVVHALQVSCCFFAYSSQKPGSPEKSRSNKTKRFDDSLPGKCGYINNRRLLFACQNISLFGQLSAMQNSFIKTKARWLEFGMKVGWILRDKHKQYITFLRRITRNKHYRSGSLEWSSFRQFMRRTFPLIEAIIYTDNNSLREPEANAVYGGLLISSIRILFFAIFGYLVSQILVSAFVPTKFKTPSSSSQGSDRRIQEDAFFVAKEIAVLATLFIRVTITVSAVFSKRVRCLLLLLVPSLALNVGQSYLGAELVHTIIMGPAATTERNLRSAAETLNCLMELAANVTKDAKRLYEELQIDQDLGEAKSYYDSIQRKSAELTERLEVYKESADRLMNEVMKSEQLVKKTEKYIRPHKGKGEDGVDAQMHQRQNLLSRMTDRLSEQEANNTKSASKRSKEKLKKLLSRMGSNKTLLSSLNKKIDSGAKIELMIKRRLTSTCMVFHNIRGKICFLSSVKACERLQTVLSALFFLPILIKRPCIRQIAKGVACPNHEATEMAAKECGGSGSKFGIHSGFGAMFYQATDSLRELESAFVLRIQMPKLKPPAVVDWARRKSSAVKAVVKRTKESLQMLLRISLIASVLLKLLALLVFRKASTYITSYLTDPEFDNVYVDKAFEAIDAKRFEQSRETLLPLKNFEKNKVFWRRKGYTKAELVKATTTLVKVLGLGFVLSAFFFIDIFMADAISMLDVATAGNIQIGKGSTTSDRQRRTEPGLQLKGDGIFYFLVEKTISVLNKISQIDITIRLNVCSPRVQYTDPYYVTRFIIIWSIMMTVALSSGYLLRVRHMILDFFYPCRKLRRVVALYNLLLINRRRHMTVCRNLIIHQARQDHLQAEAREISGEKAMQSISPFLSRLLGQDRVKCLLCLNPVKLGPGVFVCPYDDTATCLGCLAVLFQGRKTCITCLDRNPRQLFQIQRKIQNVKETIASNVD